VYTHTTLLSDSTTLQRYNALPPNTETKALIRGPNRIMPPKKQAPVDPPRETRRAVKARQEAAKEAEEEQNAAAEKDGEDGNGNGKGKKKLEDKKQPVKQVKFEKAKVNEDNGGDGADVDVKLPPTIVRPPPAGKGPGKKKPAVKAATEYQKNDEPKSSGIKPKAGGKAAQPPKNDNNPRKTAPGAKPEKPPKTSVVPPPKKAANIAPPQAELSTTEDEESDIAAVVEVQPKAQPPGSNANRAQRNTGGPTTNVRPASSAGLGDSELNRRLREADEKLRREQQAREQRDPAGPAPIGGLVPFLDLLVPYMRNDVPRVQRVVNRLKRRAGVPDEPEDDDEEEISPKKKRKGSDGSPVALDDDDGDDNDRTVQETPHVNSTSFLTPGEQAPNRNVLQASESKQTETPTKQTARKKAVPPGVNIGEKPVRDTPEPREREPPVGKKVNVAKDVIENNREGTRSPAPRGTKSPAPGGIKSPAPGGSKPTGRLSTATTQKVKSGV
jgi:hypothetical protein